MTFAPGSSEACANVTLVNSVDLEMSESLTVTLELTNPDLDDRIVVNEDYNEGEVEIIDDDGRKRSILVLPLEWCTFS